MTDGVFARDLSHDLTRLPDILDKLAAHRPWYSDETWADPELRRRVASRYLAEGLTSGKAWTVWRGGSLVGVMLLNQLDFSRRDGQCHFVFFDRSLADKQALALNAMRWCFERLGLETLRTEIPTYAHILARWARKRLGFRFESEGRPLVGTTRRLTAADAEVGSRKFHAIRYKGEWHDALLLSLTREEHFAHARSQDPTQRRQHRADSGVDATSPPTVAWVLAEPATDDEPVPSDERPPATDR